MCSGGAPNSYGSLIQPEERAVKVEKKEIELAQYKEPERAELGSNFAIFFTNAESGPILSNLSIDAGYSKKGVNWSDTRVQTKCGILEEFCLFFSDHIYPCLCETRSSTVWGTRRSGAGLRSYTQPMARFLRRPCTER
jgi:hypothetical protein